LLWNRDATGSQCDLLSVFRGDLGVNVELCPAIGATLLPSAGDAGGCVGSAAELI
jgi:hypothetical protein